MDEKEKLEEAADKIAELFLESLQREMPNHKILITFSVFKDDDTETWGGWHHTQGLTLKDACWLQGFNIAQMLVNPEED